MNRNLQPQQFFHGSDHEFKPGDEVLSPKRYDVYATNTVEDASFYGRHVYEVKPTGPVHEDPEGWDNPDAKPVYSEHPMTVIRKLYSRR